MNIKHAIIKITSIGLIVSIVGPLGAQAAPITNRSLSLASSAPSASTSHTLSFTIPSSSNVGSIKFEYCTTAYSACVTPTGLVTNTATLSAQSGATGFTIVNATNGAPYITRAALSVTGPQGVSYTLSNVTNPSVSNTEYWTRITTYAATNATGGFTDDGVVAWDITNNIVVTGTMPESLVFCVGTSGTDCTNITGSAVALGIFSPTASNAGTSLMSASTNAGFGYSITLVGTTLSSGANTIPAMGTQTQNSSACAPSCTSTTGSSQFGTNVRTNTTPPVGADVSGPGTATGFNGYNAINAFRFMSGDKVASIGGVTKNNLFTNSYIVNVGGDQAAGVYTATMTYICTATF